MFTPAKKHTKGRPYGGNILLLQKEIFIHFIIILQEDFTTTLKSNELLISGVYLQPTGADCDYREIYQNQLSTLTGIIKQFNTAATPIKMGDFQCFPSLPINQTRKATPTASLNTSQTSSPKTTSILSTLQKKLDQSTPTITSLCRTHLT